ncbi:DUF2125 domain-containing protein [Tateyamaria pelophila]|uniref:DUF2125 domain-containing protein n=1 Tax=Tateyamaria pelophila TaxID=328415 RepID=UPI001CC1B5A6|nr:DUF2125 domain-containing protein [Tateyamaria pelophila]
MKRLLFIVLLLPLLVWGVLWVFASTAVSQAIESNLKGRSFDGVAVNVNEYTVSGFPTSLNVTLTNLEAVTKDPILSWQVPIIRANFDVFNPTQVKLAAPGEHNIRTAIGDAILNADVVDVTARLILENALPLGDVSVDLKSVELRSADESGIDLERLTGTFRRIESAKYGLDVFVDNLLFADVLDPDFKDKLPAMYQSIENLNAQAVLGLDRDLNRFLLDETASLRLTTITDFKALTKLGESPLILAGDFELDEQGLLTGPLTVRVENWRQLHQVAIENGLIPQDIQGFVSDVLNQWSQMADEEDIIELPLQLKSGYIVLGMLRLGFVPGYSKI